MPMKDTKYVPIREATAITLSTLGAKTAVLGYGPQIDQALFITRSDIIVTTTQAAEHEALIIGICDADLTAAEVEECLEAGGPLHNRDTERDEHSRRRVQTVGIIDRKESGFSENQILSSIYEWKHNTKMSFTEDGAQPGWAWWVYNPHPDALSTGTVIHLNALHHARWM